MSRISIAFLVVLMLLATASFRSSAEVVKKRYKIDVSGLGSYRAKQTRAEGLARKRFLADYISGKLSPELVQQLREEIDIALTPSDSFVKGFQVLKADESEDGSMVVTVSGEVDVPLVVEALVSNHVLRFSDPAPKVLLMPSGRAADAGVTKSIRALTFEHLKNVGLRPVAFEGATRVTSVQQHIDSNQVRLIASSVTEYQADFIVFIDAEPETRPSSVGGYICDMNLTYSIIRPNTNVILGEGIASDRGSGNTATLALDRALDSTAPVIASRAIGQLYESIFADSDVITDKPQIKNSFTLTVLFKNDPSQIQQIIDALQQREVTVSLASGGAADRLVLETTTSQVDLFNVLNSIRLKGATPAKTQVVEFTENTLTVEIVNDGTKATRIPATPPSPPAGTRAQAAVIRTRGN
jgi:hypothetical protein